MRIGGIQEKGTLKTTIRDVFFVWIGPGVGIIEKGKKTGFLGEAQAFLQVCFIYITTYSFLDLLIWILLFMHSFQPYHADITVLNKKKFTREEILDKSAPLSGSHVIS